MPTVKFIRGTEVLGTLVGGGKEFYSKFAQLWEKHSSSVEKRKAKALADLVYDECMSPQVYGMATSKEQLAMLAASPLQELENFVVSRTRDSLGLKTVSGELPFDVSQHEATGTAVAKSMISRMGEDIEAWAGMANKSEMLRFSGITERVLQQFFEGDASAADKLTSSCAELAAALDQLKGIRDTDSKLVNDNLPLLIRGVNYLDVGEQCAPEQHFEKLKFILQREAHEISTIWIELLFGALLSSKGAEDLCRMNPYLSENRCNFLLDMVSTVVLRANRVGHANRCIGAGVDLQLLIDKTLKMPEAERKDAAPALLPKLLQAGEALAKNLMTKRAFVGEDLTYDPRYLIFEFTWNILLRRQQVKTVQDLMQQLQAGKSKVKQMVRVHACMHACRHV